MSSNDKNNSTHQPNLDELIPLSKAAKISGLSTAFLRRLVSNGQIWGVKVGRNWVTTEKDVQEYLDSDRKRGPKPKNHLDN
jgi:hypothetical protein